MTTITASVFAGLAGANPSLIARAVTLINDQRLTLLEPLRQELNNGTWTIRLATASDPMNGKSAMFVPPGTDAQGNHQPGQIVLRLDELLGQGDARVLGFIDNLVHEAEHGFHILDRDAAVQALLNSQGDLTTRGDLFLDTMLDDETSARLTAWKFRLQLDSLATGSPKRSDWLLCGRFSGTCIHSIEELQTLAKSTSDCGFNRSMQRSG